MEFDTEAPKEQIDAARREKREKKDRKAKRKEGEVGDSESESEGMRAKNHNWGRDPFIRTLPEIRTS